MEETIEHVRRLSPEEQGVLAEMLFATVLDEYHASPEELVAIDRGIEAADAGRFASQSDIDSIFAKHSTV